MAKITLSEKQKELDIDIWIIMIVSSPRSVKIASSPPLRAAKAAIPCGSAVRKQHNCCPPPASLKKKPESDKEF